MSQSPALQTGDRIRITIAFIDNPNLLCNQCVEIITQHKDGAFQREETYHAALQPAIDYAVKRLSTLDTFQELGVVGTIKE
jgi:hypothetical protein